MQNLWFEKRGENIFAKVFNDYSCIYKDEEIKNLAHYTDIDAIISILENKELKAKSIMDFGDDGWEGRLSLKIYIIWL